MNDIIKNYKLVIIEKNMRLNLLLVIRRCHINTKILKFVLTPYIMREYNHIYFS